MITLRVVCCLTRVSLSRGKFGNDSNNDNDNDRDIDSDNNNDNRYIAKLMIKIFCMMYSVYIDTCGIPIEIMNLYAKKTSREVAVGSTILQLPESFRPLLSS